MGDSVSVNIKANDEKNGIEVYFDAIPNEEIREKLKQNGFRWNYKKACWYAKANEYTKKIANSLMTEKEEVSIGDYFVMSWGYEQTNVDFFQVLSVTKKGVRIREVNPPMIKDDTEKGGMSANRTYKLDKAILPPCVHPSFVKNQEKGDFKVLKNYGSSPQISMTSYADAHLEKKDEVTVYESWYA